MNAMMALLSTQTTPTTLSNGKIDSNSESNSTFAMMLGNLQTSSEHAQAEAPTSLTNQVELNEWIASFIGLEVDIDTLQENELIQSFLDVLPDDLAGSLMQLLGLLNNEQTDMSLHSSEDTDDNWSQSLLDVLNVNNQEKIKLSEETVMDMVNDWPEEQLALVGVLLSYIQAEQRTDQKLSLNTERKIDQLFPVLKGENQSIERQLARIIHHLQNVLQERTGDSLMKGQTTSPNQTFKEAMNQLMATGKDDMPLLRTAGNERPLNQGLFLPQNGIELGQLMSRSQQATIHIGEHQPKQVQQEQLLKQFEQMMQRGAFRKNEAGMNTFSVKLYPQHLGRIDIQLTQINGVLIARLLTSSSGARELVESQLQQLRQAFINQNLTVERVEVSQQQQSAIKDEDSSNKQQSKDQQDRKERDTDESQETFQEFLEELTINEEV
ncbi:flagellar hook-length control protein FliK [Bacillus sp. FJAT-45037]|uniref:flagellar hook-length control protein FliK n=1 Tax=Bacillus sp. FJAT-45037 TaxID=2011007 RepID=UPI000C246898|nr:flagellar hook-length control protein FliK [Bacillus sp. FJAT-45037]